MIVHAARVAVGLAVIATTVFVGAAPASAATGASEALPSCLDHRWTGNTGVINVRTSPSRTIAWNVLDFTDNGGLWHALVFVDGRKVDEKTQNYNPHGSVNPRFSRSGSVFKLDITHTDTQGRVSHSVPNGCIVP